jgi:hypothetical protein
MLSASNETFLARGSRANAFIPIPFDQFLILFSYPHKFTELGRIHPKGFCDADMRQHPEFSYRLTPSYVNMQWLRRVTFIREEKEPIPLVPENHRHI